MFRIAIAIIVGGGFLAFYGFQENKLSSLCKDTAEKVDLKALEDGQELTNMNIEIGPHWAIYSQSIYEYTQSKYDSSEPDNSTTVTSTSYPIISEKHPFNIALDKLQAKYGSLENVPESEIPEFKDFRVLVKTDRFKTIGGIPDNWGEIQNVQGLVINEIDNLDNEEIKLLKQNWPHLNTDKVLILEIGREPSSSSASMAMMGGGGLISIAGVGLMLWMRKKE
ncbi:MAG: hypothetical protein K9M57_02360 [Phycisphaerae bacterium]|nr:hypothetical protein [Phycisphaerae bacterium]